MAIVSVHGLAGTNRAIAQVRGPFSTEGTVKELRAGTLVINDAAGRTWQLRFAGSDGVVSLANNRKFRARKPTVEVTGTLGKDDLEKGMPVKFECYMNDDGRVRTPVAEIDWLDSAKPGIKQNRRKQNERGDTLSQVVGTIQQVDPRGMIVQVRSRLTKKGTLPVPLDPKLVLNVKTRDLSRAREGDDISLAQGVELVTGDFVLQKIKVEMRGKSAGERRATRQPRAELELSAGKYETLSDEPVAPRMVRDSFLPLITDLSDRKSRGLLDELKETLQWLTQVYGRKPSAPIELRVVSDANRWSPTQLSAELRALIGNGESKVVGGSGDTSARRKIVIYAPAKVANLRADLVHAFCLQAFGDAGPEWYESGMSDVAKHWSKPPTEVKIDETKLRVFARNQAPKSIAEITATSDTESNDTPSDALNAAEQRRKRNLEARQARELEAYRWAICYIMANHGHYRKPFQQFSAQKLSGREVTLEKAFAKTYPELEFEFEQFVRNVKNGYRLDLAAWNWSHRFTELTKSQKHKVTIQAKMGWQPVVSVTQGTSYDMVAQGKWRIDGAGTDVSADGDSEGIGKVIAVVLQENKQLTKPIEVGAKLRWQAPVSGKLYMRCSEDWSMLADNAGAVTVHIRVSKSR